MVEVIQISKGSKFLFISSDKALKLLSNKLVIVEAILETSSDTIYRLNANGNTILAGKEGYGKHWYLEVI